MQHSSTMQLPVSFVKTTAHSLCAILLLEDSTPRQAFTDFLVARKAALQALFRSIRQTSIKSQVCDIVSLVMATVRHTEAVFSHQESGIFIYCIALLATVSVSIQNCKLLVSRLGSLSVARKVLVIKDVYVSLFVWSRG
jgi:hypothetical protein